MRRSVTVKREGRRIAGSKRGGWTSNYSQAGQVMATKCSPTAESNEMSSLNYPPEFITIMNKNKSINIMTHCVIMTTRSNRIAVLQCSEKLSKTHEHIQRRQNVQNLLLE